MQSRMTVATGGDVSYLELLGAGGSLGLSGGRDAEALDRVHNNPGYYAIDAEAIVGATNKVWSQR